MKKFLLFTLFFAVGTFLQAQTVIIDHETDATTTTFSYFGMPEGASSVIANPDMSGANTSAMVGQFVKAAGSEPWAGGFSNPVPTTPVDLTTDSEICMKVWMPNAGNVALKLENGDPALNWINIAEITETETWVDVCFNTNNLSAEAPIIAAAGNVYTTVVLFFDFQEVVDPEETYFFDDLVVQEGDALEPVDVTFSVDMNEYEADFTQVYVSGTFNEWSGDANPLSDDDNDGVWEGTVENIAAGSHEYKITLDNWNAQEQFSGTEVCTITDPSGQFVNRSLSATMDMTVPTHCFNSCFACGESINITIELGAGGVTVDENGFFIAGGGNFGNPGDFPLSDDDNDGVYTATFERAVGFESFYTFTNGNCPDYSCKEMIAGQDCANPDNFNDRFMGPFTEDATIATCFEQCTTTTDCGAVTSSQVTFQVDMTPFTETIETVYVAGTFNNFSENANPMTDLGNNIWETTIELTDGSYEYKFQVNQWAFQEIFTDGMPCTITSGDMGQFINRTLEVSGDAEMCFVYASCAVCETSTQNLPVDNGIFSVQPTLVQTEAVVTFGSDFTAAKQLTVVNMLGQTVNAVKIDRNTPTYVLDMSDLQNGLYFINAETEGKQQTQRIMVSR